MPSSYPSGRLRLTTSRTADSTVRRSGGSAFRYPATELALITAADSSRRTSGRWADAGVEVAVAFLDELDASARGDDERHDAGSNVVAAAALSGRLGQDGDARRVVTTFDADG